VKHPANAEAAASGGEATRVYRPPMPRGWWLRQRHYFLYASGSPAFIAFSIVCLGFALYHSYTFLSLAGVIINIKVAGKPVPSRIIVLSQFAAWFVASVVIAAVLIGFAR
jgi:fumarate reductase subunit C